MFPRSGPVVRAQGIIKCRSESPSTTKGRHKPQALDVDPRPGKGRKGADVFVFVLVFFGNGFPSMSLGPPVERLE